MPHITLNNIKYFFQAKGPIQADISPLVLVHGSGGDCTVWHQQLEALSADRRVIAVDLPGHGQSEDSPGNSAEEYARWLKQLIDGLQLPSVVLVGHSLGGIVAQQFAWMYPGLTEALVLVGTGMRFDIPQEYLELLKKNFHEALKTSCRQAYAGELPAEVLDRGLFMLQRNGPGVLFRDLAVCGGFDNSGWARAIKVPTLVVCGRQDSITPYELSTQLAQAIAGSKLKGIDGAGHMVMQEQPESFNKVISYFLKTCCRPLQQSA